MHWTSLTTQRRWPTTWAVFWRSCTLRSWVDEMQRMQTTQAIPHPKLIFLLVLAYGLCFGSNLYSSSWWSRNSKVSFDRCLIDMIHVKCSHCMSAFTTLIFLNLAKWTVRHRKHLNQAALLIMPFAILTAVPWMQRYGEIWRDDVRWFLNSQRTWCPWVEPLHQGSASDPSRGSHRDSSIATRGSTGSLQLLNIIVSALRSGQFGKLWFQQLVW